MRVFLLISMIVALFSSSYALGVGDTAPEFSLTDLDGTQHSLSAYRGKVVYIFFLGWG